MHRAHLIATSDVTLPRRTVWTGFQLRPKFREFVELPARSGSPKVATGPDFRCEQSNITNPPVGTVFLQFRFLIALPHTAATLICNMDPAPVAAKVAQASPDIASAAREYLNL